MSYITNCTRRTRQVQITTDSDVRRQRQGDWITRDDFERMSSVILSYWTPRETWEETEQKFEMTHRTHCVRGTPATCMDTAPRNWIRENQDSEDPSNIERRHTWKCENDSNNKSTMDNIGKRGTAIIWWDDMNQTTYSKDTSQKTGWASILQWNRTRRE